jgi:hypothetical protein
VTAWLPAAAIVMLAATFVPLLARKPATPR